MEVDIIGIQQQQTVGNFKTFQGPDRDSLASKLVHAKKGTARTSTNDHLNARGSFRDLRGIALTLISLGGVVATCAESAKGRSRALAIAREWLGEQRQLEGRRF